MVYRFTIAAILTLATVSSVNAQSNTRNVAPVPQMQSQPRPFAQQQFGQATMPRQSTQIPGQGLLGQQGQYQNTRPIIGSGLPGAQKDGCNCFQMPDLDFSPKYDPYASKNYWTDICPNGNCGGGCQGGCAQPRFDFNRFIPRPTGPLFRRF